MTEPEIEAFPEQTVSFEVTSDCETNLSDPTFTNTINTNVYVMKPGALDSVATFSGTTLCTTAALERDVVMNNSA